MKTCVFEPKELLTVYPVTIGYNYVQEKIVQPTGVKFHQIFVVSGGSGILGVCSQKHNLEKGDMFFISKNTEHYYEGSSGFKTTFMGFDGDLCSNIFKYYSVGKFGVYKGKNSKTAEAVIGNFYENFENPGGFAMLSATAYSAITTFFDSALKSDCTPIETVKNYIEANFSREVTLNDIMEFYPYSKAKLCRDFSSKYGMTVFDMLTKIRLRHAFMMLKNDSQIKLKSVAASCGFNDLSYFCRVYKREYGKSPKSIT